VNPYNFFWKSSIGKKWLIALTGLVLIAYVIGHLIGNLQLFAAPEVINGYAGFLHRWPGLLWAIRLFLIACLVLHVLTTLKLVAENRAARFHLLHFTARTIDPSFKPVSEPGGIMANEYDAHTMVIAGFAGHPLITGFYLLGLFLLCLHLSHGFSSLLQTIGINSKRNFTLYQRGGQILAWLIFAGYAIIPVAIWLHYFKS
jgi:succinate dehydrogenase / fumarate reductase cytochrome b subunit